MFRKNLPSFSAPSPYQSPNANYISFISIMRSTSYCALSSSSTSSTKPRRISSDVNGKIFPVCRMSFVFWPRTNGTFRISLTPYRIWKHKGSEYSRIFFQTSDLKNVWLQGIYSPEPLWNPSLHSFLSSSFLVVSVFILSLFHSNSLQTKTINLLGYLKFKFQSEVITSGAVEKNTDFYRFQTSNSILLASPTHHSWQCCTLTGYASTGIQNLSEMILLNELDYYHYLPIPLSLKNSYGF